MKVKKYKNYSLIVSPPPNGLCSIKSKTFDFTSKEYFNYQESLTDEDMDLIREQLIYEIIKAGFEENFKDYL